MLLLDEPSVGVDPISRRELWAMVQALKTTAWRWCGRRRTSTRRIAAIAVLMLDDGRHRVRRPAGRPHETCLSGAATDSVADRTRSSRACSAEALDLEIVRDGVIEGDAIRVVLNEGAGAEPIREGRRAPRRRPGAGGAALRRRVHRPARRRSGWAFGHRGEKWASWISAPISR